MNQNPYQPPHSNRRIPFLYAKSSLVAGLTGVAIWLIAIGSLWFYYEPTFSKGEMLIEISGPSGSDPYLYYYMEIRTPVWEVIAQAILLLLVIFSGTFGITWLYKRRRKI